MIIDFDEKTHTYSINGEIATVSVTEMLHHQGIAPDYSAVNKELLEESATRGTEIHKDLENICNDSEYVCKTKEGESFLKWKKSHIASCDGEKRIAYTLGDFILAGTADVVGYDLKEDLFFVADHKTTSSVNREYVSWQVSILDYMLRQSEDLVWFGAEKLYCFHYKKDGTMQAIELCKKTDAEIEELIRCEMCGERYKAKELMVDGELENNLAQAEKLLIQKELEYRAAKAAAEQWRNKLKCAFEEQNVRQIKIDNVTFTYVAESNTRKLDTQRLKEAYSDVYTDCLIESPRSAYIKVTTKNEL